MSKTDAILNKVRESFSLVRQDIERLDAAFDRLGKDNTKFQNESVNTLEILDKRQKLIESSTAKLMTSHGTSLHSMLKVNGSVIALKQTLDAMRKQNKSLADDNRKLRKQLQQVNSGLNKKLKLENKKLKKQMHNIDVNIRKKLTAMNTDIKKRVLKKVKSKPKKK